jgi:hypothetical protein
MNPKPSARHLSSPHDARIAAALDHFARATPPPGLESRVAARLSAAGRLESSRSAGSVRLLLLRRLSVGAMAAAAVCAIVFGTVEHARRNPMPQMVRGPQTGGVDISPSVHIPTHPIPQSAEINPDAPRNPPHGRAVLSRNHSRHAAGAAVPRSPYPPESQPTNPAEPKSDPQQ